MLNIDRALGNDRLLRALTGLNRKAFDELCQIFAAVYQETLQSDLKPRKRARGGGGGSSVAKHGVQTILHLGLGRGGQLNPAPPS